MKVATYAALGSLTLISSQALAHPGHDVTGNALLNGLLHPFTGMDHMLALTGLGAMAALAATRKVHQLLLALIATVAAGAIGGLMTTSALALEFMLGLSLLAMPVLLISHRGNQIVQNSAIGTALLFSLAHGAVQGAESAGMTMAVIGLVLSSSLLMLGGFGITRLALKQRMQLAVVRKD